MSNYVLIVNLEIRPEHLEEFLAAARQQAEKSISLEAGCRRFDILHNVDERHQVTHYEIFEDKDAFQKHAGMDHTAAFAKKIEPMVVNVEMHHAHLGLSASK